MDLITLSSNTQNKNSLSSLNSDKEQGSSQKTDIDSTYSERALERDYSEMDKDAVGGNISNRNRRAKSNNRSISNNDAKDNYRTFDKSNTILSNKNTSNTNTYSDISNTYNNFSSKNRSVVNSNSIDRNNVYSDNLTSLRGGQDITDEYIIPSDTKFYDASSMTGDNLGYSSVANRSENTDVNTSVRNNNESNKSMDSDRLYRRHELTNNGISNDRNRNSISKLYGGSFDDDLMGASNVVLDNEKIMKRLDEINKKTFSIIRGGKADSELNVTWSNTPGRNKHMSKTTTTYDSESNNTSDYMPNNRYTKSEYGSETSPMNITTTKNSREEITKSNRNSSNNKSSRDNNTDTSSVTEKSVSFDQDDGEKIDRRLSLRNKNPKYVTRNRHVNDHNSNRNSDNLSSNARNNHSNKKRTNDRQYSNISDSDIFTTSG